VTVVDLDEDLKDNVNLNEDLEKEFSELEFRI